MGFVKRFLSRLFNRKSKLKERTESPWITIDATAADLEHEVSSSSLESPFPPFGLETTIGTSVCTSCLEVVLWQPSPLSVPLVPATPLEALLCLRSTSTPLVSIARALALSSPPAATLDIPVQHLISSILFGTRHEYVSAPRSPSTLDVTTSSIQDLEAFSAADALIQDCQLQNLLEPTVASVPSQSSDLPSQSGALGLLSSPVPSNGVPSLVSCTTTDRTSYLGTPEVLSHPLALGPSANPVHMDAAKALKKIPRYPPGLGFPTEEVDDPSDVGIKKPSLVPTVIIARRQPSLVTNVPIDRREPSIAPPGSRLGEAIFHDIPSEVNNGYERAGSQPQTNEGEYEEADVYDPAELDKWREKYGEIMSPFEVNSGPFKYQILSTIGRGGNGTVWHGQLLEGEKPMDVAIKVINTTLAYSRHVTDRRLIDRVEPFVLHYLIKDTDEAAFWIQHELDVLRRLGQGPSPFLSPLLHAFRDEQNFYFVMRYYPENLRERAQHKARRLHLFQLRLIAAELVLALQTLHSKRVVHQDLKLENVLVTPTGHICICDFGNTAVFDENMSDERFKEKSLEGVYGTDGYQAPELFTGKHNYKVDMWGLGIMLVELFLNGGMWYYAIPEFREVDPRFFDFDEPSPLHPRVTNKIYDSDARDLIMKLLNNDPEKRPEWTAVKEHSFFKRHIQWESVKSRQYDPKYRACDADKERRPLIKPENWVRQQRPESSIQAMEEILNRAADKKKGPGGLAFSYLPQCIVEDDCHGAVIIQYELYFIITRFELPVCFLSKMSRSTTMLTVAGIAVGGLVAYAVYFDYKRRTDATFRKQLRKDKKRIAKSQTPSETSAPGGVDANELRSALENVRKEEVPASPEEKEQYFMSQVGMGEQLCTQGPAFHLPAAMCFYRALRVYPSPVELIVIYEKTVPGPVFQIVMQLTNMDVKDRVEGYYDSFPPKAMNVAVKTVDVPQSASQSGTTMKKKILVCTKDFEPGEVIYKEEAVVVALDADLQGKGTYCSHCLRHLAKAMVIRPESDRLDSVYCSKDCQVKAKTSSQGLLFTLDSPLPGAIAPEVSGGNDSRDNAQIAFTAYLKEKGRAGPELVARFIACQVAAETTKMLPPQLRGPGVTKAVPTDGGDYTLYDHLERLRYLEVSAPEDETKLLKDVLQTALPGLEQFVTEERHATYLGAMSYNAFGVCYGGGRDDKPEPTERPEDVEKTRTPYGAQKQIGAGFYAVSSYLNHSCVPSARPSFSSGTSELFLIAHRALKAGDELTVAYVDVSQREGETVVEARRRRRMELARGWRFACTCSRCAEEADPTAESEGEAKDESRWSDAVLRVEVTCIIPHLTHASVALKGQYDYESDLPLLVNAAFNTMNITRSLQRTRTFPLLAPCSTPRACPASTLTFVRAFRPTTPTLLHKSLPARDSGRPTTLTNMLASDVPPPVQVSSISDAGITLADGLVLKGAVVFLEGKVFLWDVPLSGGSGGSGIWDSWTKEHWSIFEVVVPRPEILIFGTGRRMEFIPSAIRGHMKELGIQMDVMDTKNACSTYNLLAEEGRRVAAALLPLESKAWTKKTGL
ncbi:hypothetical protein F5I97DRAFT_2072803 [Phlebopus sp. FC_14]|nr:hypothetical protein F5I97DRAFT_2072803 [Phlebopus sp. FC_14]